MRGFRAAALIVAIVDSGAVSSIGATRAESTVKIGAIYPLTGVAAGAGNYAKTAIETGIDIVNNPHPGLENLLLGKGQGLPNLSGAKITVEFADQQGSPSVAQSQTLRLITQNHVV